MAAALALSARGRARTAPNPNVGCVIVRAGCVVGRGWTQPGGRPHAEAMALEEAGDSARGGCAYVTLEPCAHDSARGPNCTDLLIAAGVARVVMAIQDPDRRTKGRGAARLAAAGIAVTTGVCAGQARHAMAGFLTKQALGRPYVTLKLATSLDGCIALSSGESRWITGAQARAHGHLERARHEAILVGRATFETDAPQLDVRLPGLEDRSPRRVMLTSRGAALGAGADDWQKISAPGEIAHLNNVDHLLVEGGAQTAAAFLQLDLIDRLLLYRAPIVIGSGKAAVAALGLEDLAAAHGRWVLSGARRLGSDALEVYERAKQED